MSDPLGVLQSASQQQKKFNADTTPQQRKERGHFGTPIAIAEFMAGLFDCIPQNEVRVLDAGAGVGTLAAAVCARIMKLRQPRTVFIELWEDDESLLPLLQSTMKSCQKALAHSGHNMSFQVRNKDFILGNTRQTLFSNGPKPNFDLAILNPPYFKIRKGSPQARAMEHIIHGQPNIYACFLAVAAELLVEGGELVAITPRSYFNGPYFRRFRNWFFKRMIARHIHVFESRSDAFQEDAVLQENVILNAKCVNRKPETVTYSTSNSRDFKNTVSRKVPYSCAIDNRKHESIIRVVSSEYDQQVLECLDKLPDTPETLGLKISTGPVVTFRATKFLRNARSSDTAPLLWMHNVRPFVTRPPAKNGKPSHIEVGQKSQRLLLPAKRYILLKRFTSKEEKKRLVAGIMRSQDCYSKWVGLENHLNYLHRADGELTEHEAVGLAAYLNTNLADRYFRSISGNTQVNAGELRNLPMPSLPEITELGRHVAEIGIEDSVAIERIVGQMLTVDNSLLNVLMEII